MTAYKTSQNSNIGGIILVLLGGYFLLNNFDLISSDLKYYIFNWRAILLLIGVYIIASKPNKKPGYILIAIGTLFILSRIYQDLFGHIVAIKEIFWPLALIIVGLFIIYKKKYIPSQSTNHNTWSQDYIDDTVVLGGGEVIIQSNEHKGGRINTLFGGSSYDFTQAKLANGNNTLEVFAMFGGVSFKVPSDWNVHIEVTAIFGGFADKRKHIDPNTGSNEAALIIRGFVMFGGGEIKNY